MINESQSASFNFDDMPSSTEYRTSIDGVRPSEIEPVRRLFWVDATGFDSPGKSHRFFGVIASINSQL